MKQFPRHPWVAPHFLWTTSVASVIALIPFLPKPAHAQALPQVEVGDMLLFESSAASRVSEKVRALAPGVMMELFVKPGEYVHKGQILGHTELDAAKLQLDLAKQTFESKTNVDAAEAQADAWLVTRDETEELVRKRKAEKSRLDWATAMEKMHRANFEGQLEAEKIQKIQYDFARKQYEKRFFRAPVSGVVTEGLVEIGKNVNFGTHVFTISNNHIYTVPVSVPAPIAAAVSPNGKLPVRSADGNVVKGAVVDSVTDNPKSAGEKIVRLLIEAADFPVATRARLAGMKFDVLLPQLAGEPKR